MSSTFKDIPIVGWSVDSLEDLKEIFDRKNGQGSFYRYLDSYKRGVFETMVSPLFSGASFDFNLGGKNDKSKLIATDKANGVFNFALASPTLYPLQEYYSEELAREQPNKFESFELLSGIIPPDLVQELVVSGQRKFFYKDDETGKEYYCIKQKKGQAEIDAGVQGAKYKYASKTKKVYQTYSKRGGKVKYVEIYSLTYFSSLDGDLQYAVRHIPALMAAEYLESIGVKTRVYITRFVRINEPARLRKKEAKNGLELPMGNTPLGDNFKKFLIVQPIIVKDFMQEVDKNLMFCVGSANYREILNSSVSNAYSIELSNFPDLYGNPDWSQNDYWEGIERYRSKYKQYVDLGLKQSKEVLPEAMIFFHDLSIKNLFEDFVRRIRRLKVFNILSEVEVLTNPEVNEFFMQWMKTSANKIKHKINLLNSTNLVVDMLKIHNDVLESKMQFRDIIRRVTIRGAAKNTFTEFFDKIIIELRMGNTFLYIQDMTQELKTFADDMMYPTSIEDRDKRNNFVKKVLSELVLLPELKTP